jgi:hypothetical protein
VRARVAGGAAAAAVLLGGAGTAVAVSPAAGSSMSAPAVARSAPASGARTLTVRLRGGWSTFVNVRAKSGYAAGDEFIGAQPAYRAGGTAVIGRMYVVITLISKSADRIDATLRLGHSQLELAGIEAGDPFTLAVTGGTGQYAGATGTATLRTGSGSGNPSTVTIRLS